MKDDGRGEHLDLIHSYSRAQAIEDGVLHGLQSVPRHALTARTSATGSWKAASS